MNSSRNTSVAANPLSASIGLTSAYTLTFIVALLGNSFAIHIVRVASHTPFDLLILNMAICDIIYAFAAAPFGIHYIWVTILWFPGEFGVFLCKFKEFILVVSISTSVFTLIVMSADRYLAIVPALKRPLSRKNVLAALGGVWGVSILSAIPELYKMSVRKHGGVTYCYARWTDDREQTIEILQIEFIVRFVMIFVLPLVIMVIFYARLIRYLWKRQPPGVRNNKKQRRDKQKYRRVVLMLVAMVTSFALGWLPIYIVLLLKMFNYHNIEQLLPSYAQLLMTCIAHAQSSINPCLLMIFNESFKQEFYRLTVLRIRRLCSSLALRLGILHKSRADSGRSVSQVTEARDGEEAANVHSNTNVVNQIFDTRL